MSKHVGKVDQWHILQVHLALGHLPILFWKHAKVCHVLCCHQGCSTGNCTLKDIESRPKFIVLIGGSFSEVLYILILILKRLCTYIFPRIFSYRYIFPCISGTLNFPLSDIEGTRITRSIMYLINHRLTCRI